MSTRKPARACLFDLSRTISSPPANEGRGPAYAQQYTQAIMGRGGGCVPGNSGDTRGGRRVLFRFQHQCFRLAHTRAKWTARAMGALIALAGASICLMTARRRATRSQRRAERDPRHAGRLLQISWGTAWLLWIDPCRPSLLCCAQLEKPRSRLKSISLSDRVIERVWTSEIGTSRTWPNVRLGSAFRSRAEVEFRGRQAR